MTKKLIFVEGLPGTGKTTITHWITEHFISKGYEAIALFEDNIRIPTNFANIAGIPKEAFYNLYTLDNSSAPWVEKSIQAKSYRFARLDDIHDNTMLLRWDMGDEWNKNLSVSDYVHCALEWIEHKINDLPDGVVVLDNALLQSPVNEMLFRKASDREVLGYVQNICKLISPMEYICIYLDRGNANESMAQAIALKGPAWASRVESFLNSVEGCSHFERRYFLEKELLKAMTHVVCPVNGPDWTASKVEIMTVIQ